MVPNKWLDEILKKFPNIPKPNYWEGHGMNRYYFNKKERNQDYTFFINIRDNGSLELKQKAGSLWHPSYPKKEELTTFLIRLDNKSQKFDINIKDGVKTEFYQIDLEKFGKLYCYRLEMIAGISNVVGGKLGFQLRKRMEGFWNFSDNLLPVSYTHLTLPTTPYV